MIATCAETAIAKAQKKPCIIDESKGRWKESMMSDGVTTRRRTFTIPFTAVSSTRRTRRQTTPTAIRAKSTPTCTATVAKFCISRIIPFCYNTAR